MVVGVGVVVVVVVVAVVVAAVAVAVVVVPGGVGVGVGFGLCCAVLFFLFFVSLFFFVFLVLCFFFCLFDVCLLVGWLACLFSWKRLVETKFVSSPETNCSTNASEGKPCRCPSSLFFR